MGKSSFAHHVRARVHVKDGNTFELTPVFCNIFDWALAHLNETYPRTAPLWYQRFMAPSFSV